MQKLWHDLAWEQFLSWQESGDVRTVLERAIGDAWLPLLQDSQRTAAEKFGIMAGKGSHGHGFVG